MDIDIVGLNTEISKCRSVQNFSPTSTRSSWVWALESISRASTDEELEEAIKIADIEARNCAQRVLHCKLAYPFGAMNVALEVAKKYPEFADSIHLHEDSITSLLAYVRGEELFVDDGLNGHRDGFVITATEAYAFASLRNWRRDQEVDWVQVDLMVYEAAEANE